MPGKVKAGLSVEIPVAGTEAGWTGSLDRLHDLLAGFVQ